MCLDSDDTIDLYSQSIQWPGSFYERHKVGVCDQLNWHLHFAALDNPRTDSR